MSVGLIDDDAVVALSGVTACDHEINAATAIPIPIVPVEMNSLNMIESFRVRERCDHEPVPFQDFSVASQN
jgi:hypothetical protein